MNTDQLTPRRQALLILGDLIRSDWRMDVYYMVLSEGRHPIIAWATEIVWRIRAAVGAVMCAISDDHNLIDEGYGTPESGCIDMRCDRCGYSFRTHWLY